MSDAKQAITIKKYANRRLYNTSTSTYVTLGDLAKMVKEGIEFNVYDAKSSEDLTRGVLTQIIVEEEGKTGQNLLPISFLRQLIGFYGDNLQWMVPKYLEQSMQALSGNQEKIRSYFQNTIGSMFPFGSTLEEMSKQNMAMFERTLRMFTPFGMSEAMSKGGFKTGEPHHAQDAQEAAAEAAFTPAMSSPTPAPSNVTPMPTPATSQASTSSSQSGEDVQGKIAALQRQLADLAKGRAS
jgi:polyhydroxyalkanoate synthesis repressor PhaR